MSSPAGGLSHLPAPPPPVPALCLHVAVQGTGSFPMSFRVIDSLLVAEADELPTFHSAGLLGAESVLAVWCVDFIIL